MTDEEKNSMELDIEAKYVGRTEKEFLNNVTYDECLYILDTKNEYCDDIKNLSLLKIVDIVNEQSKEIEEYNIKILSNAGIYQLGFKDGEKSVKNKIKAKIEELEIEQESNREDLQIAIDNLLFSNIDKIADKISINMSVRGILQSL